MLSTVRKLLENWVARAFFGLLIIIFVFWGISNVVTLIGSNTAIAHIAGNPVDVALVEAAYEPQLDQARQANPAQPPDLQARQQMAAQALASVLRQQSFSLEEQSLGIAAPAAAMRQMIDAIPAFQTNGVFDQQKFDQILQDNNKTPAQFLDEVKNDVSNGQLVRPVIAGVAPPGELVNQVFSFIAEQRFAETVTIPLSGQPAPPAPSDAVLQRYWRNHQADFAAPEYRTIKLVLLAPSLLAPREQVSDADVQAAYARATQGQTAVQTRSVEIVTIDDAAKAAKLAIVWKQGADWTKMQALASKAGGNPVELDNATKAQFPLAAMGSAVFAAAPGQVTGPVQGPFSLFLFKVTKVQSSLPGQAQMVAEVKQQLQLQMAQNEVAQDVNSLQDALAGQTPLDQLPGNIGLVALQGTLDANGNEADGTPAPIPGGADLKAAVVKAAFAAHQGDPAALETGPDGSYFAFTVDSITPPSTKPYADVKAKVAAAWTADQVARAAEVKAATLMAAVNAGQSLDNAASAAGLAVTMTPPVTRNSPPTGVSQQLAQVLFTLKPGQATMQQTDSGFTVAALAKITDPGPQDDPTDYADVQSSMTKSLQDDMMQSFVSGLQARQNVTIDQKLFAQLYQ
jgi:peptidyl-prolyl cis-trans isomerase D